MTLSDLTKERIIESLSTWIENDLAQILDVGENEAVREAEQEAKNDLLDSLESWISDQRLF